MSKLCEIPGFGPVPEKEIRLSLAGTASPKQSRPIFTMNPRFFKSAAIAVLVLTLPSLVLAQQVRVFRDGGSWTQEITGSVSNHGDSVWVVGDWQGGRHRICSSEFVINVPREIDLAKIETAGGGVSVTGIAGRVEAETGGGKVHLDDIGGSVRVETGGDNIEVGNINGDARLETGGGKITINSAKGKINASTGGGNILLVSGSQGATLEAGGASYAARQ